MITFPIQIIIAWLHYIYSQFLGSNLKFRFDFAWYSYLEKKHALDILNVEIWRLAMAKWLLCCNVRRQEESLHNQESLMLLPQLPSHFLFGPSVTTLPCKEIIHGTVILITFLFWKILNLKNFRVVKEIWTAVVCSYFKPRINSFRDSHHYVDFELLLVFTFACWNTKCGDMCSFA